MPKRTKSGKLTKIGDFERKLRGKMPDSEMYAIANKEGLKRGNKDTARGMMAAGSKGKPKMPKMAKKKRGMSDMAMLKKQRMA